MNISSVYSQKREVIYEKSKDTSWFIMDGKAGGIDKYLLNFLEQVHNECVQADFFDKSYWCEFKAKLNNMILICMKLQI